MDDMDLREGKKLIHKRRRNRNERGNPPISKVESLVDTAALRNNWKVYGSTEGDSTSDKCRIGGGSISFIVSVTGQNLFCARGKHRNENDWRYCRKFSNWAEEING